MTVYKLRENYLKNNPDGHFFDEATLKFFGERFSEMRVLSKTETVKDYLGNEHVCWVLSSLQRNHPNGATRVYHYFDTETYDMILVN